MKAKNMAIRGMALSFLMVAAMVSLLPCRAFASAVAVADSLTVLGPTPGAPTPYVVIVDGVDQTSSIYIPDSVFYEIAGRTIFKVNKTDLNTSDPFVRELVEQVFPMARENEWMLVGMELRGAASPEGPYDNNVRLSRGRAKALIDYLKANIESVDFSEVNTKTVAEDYPSLLWEMQRKNDPAAEVLREIMDECGIDNEKEIKARLRAYDGGRLWKRLLKEYFPGLRSARIVLYLKHINPPLEPAPELEKVDLEASDYIEDVGFEPYEFPFRHERPHMLSVSTNILYDAFYMPNFGMAPMPNVSLEFFPKNSRWTVRATFMSPYWHKWAEHKFFQIRDYRLETRCYFNPGFRHTGLYLGAQVNFAKYGIGLSARKGWQGEGGGAGIKIGYVLPLGDSRWRIDFHAAVGDFYTRFDKYVYGNPITGELDGDYYYDWDKGSASFKYRNYQLNWIGPTEIGVTISYDVLFWRILPKKGVSFLRYY